MRFLIEYKDFKSKETENESLNSLDTFLNEHLIGKFHGHTFECILVRFLNHSPNTRKLKLKSLYKTIAEIEVPGSFTNNKEVNIEDFQSGLAKIEEAIKKAPKIEQKETLDYQEEKLLEDFRKSIHVAPKTNEELVQYSRMEQDIKFHNQAKRADCLITSSSNYPRPLTKNIVGIRIYDSFDRGVLNPYSYIFTVLFSNLLRRFEVKLPGYDEIYVSLAETMEQAKQKIALETWHKYTYATLNLTEYHSTDEKGKADMVFDSVCRGLRLIADFDHLEKAKIEKVIETIKENGMNQELVYASKQNKNHLVEIIYTVPESHLSKAEYKIRVTEQATGKSGVAPIDFIDTYWAPYSFGKILIKKHEVIIKGRQSLRAEISRQQDRLPDEYKFSIADIIK